ncbi:YqhG family protein [Brevibacillus humidisoli]|uniref:YqhG family protein n=1 Tax=Brevibacillus humidisoli TaxID=2895522 RepID=UPI001E5D84C6|nr:YqhG family protein [Brevibacillus humidisoli]UFJ42947.1 YqhG family protein [Brevibacillus humidisoli]
MNQEEVRRFTERYFAAFSSHVMESHPAYFTVKLPKIVDKDIGNRPFYWSWVEKMNIPPQPMIITFTFEPDQKPEGFRSEYLHFGSGRLDQIFQSARRHGRFVCLFEQADTRLSGRRGAERRSAPLVPWLNLNIKISFVCDKKRDVLLSFGVNLHQSRISCNFYSFVCSLNLGPSIPDYFYTLDRQLSLDQAMAMVEQEVEQVIEQQDNRWAEEARERLAEEIAILSAYYDEMTTSSENDADQQSDEGDYGGEPTLSDSKSSTPSSQRGSERPQSAAEQLPLEQPQSEQSAPESLDTYRANGGRILDFLRQYTIPETPKEEIDQSNWQQSTPQEEKERRIAELKWQYEPRIEVSLINGGLFYLYSTPPVGALRQSTRRS